MSSCFESRNWQDILVAARWQLREELTASDWGKFQNCSNWAIEDLRFEYFKLHNFKISHLLNPITIPACSALL